MLSLQPWYKKLHLKIVSKPSEDFYKFIYHTCLRNSYTGIIIDEPSKAEDIIKETLLFKNIFYNIQVSLISDYTNLNIPNKEDTSVFHYFCDLKYYKYLKDTIPTLGVYYLDINTIHNIPTNTGEINKRLHLDYLDIGEYLDFNDYTLFLDTDGNVYFNIDFQDKVCNIYNDNIEIKLFQYVLDKKGGR